MAETDDTKISQFDLNLRWRLIEKDMKRLAQESTSWNVQVKIMVLPENIYILIPHSN